MVELERSIISKQFLGSVLCMMAVLALGTSFPEFDGYQEAGIHGEILKKSFSSDVFLLLLPLICTFPYTTAMTEELETGFGKFYLLRTTRTYYIKNKLWAAWMSGVLVTVTATLVNYGIYWLLYAPVMQKAGTHQELLVPLLKSLIPVFLVSGICSLLGAVLALLVMSAYMAYIGPFVAYYLLVILKERYFGNWYSMYPKEWAAPEHDWGPENIGLYMLLLVLTGVLAGIYRMAAERRLGDA